MEKKLCCVRDTELDALPLAIEGRVVSCLFRRYYGINLYMCNIVLYL